MKIVTVRSSVPVWVLAFVRRAAGERSVQEAIGFGLMVAMNMSPDARCQLADALASSPEEERDDLEVQFAGGDRWPVDEMPLEEVVELAATIVAIAEHDPEARADFLRMMHGEDGLQ